MGLYTIGVDFGTLSGRAVVVDVNTGEIMGSTVTTYPHGVIENRLPDSHRTLGTDWALQDPTDYLKVLEEGIPEAIRLSKVDPQQVIGIGIDFTACTMMPIKADGTVLCQLDEFRDNPHAWVKLWKHHAAQKHADLINEVAQYKEKALLERYGGKISSEWLLPKVWQILEEAPEIYEACDLFVEAGDWAVMQLTGELVRSSCNAGYKGLWHKHKGYPSKSFLKELDSRLENLVEEKLSGLILPIGSAAGTLTFEMASKLGVTEGIAVAVGVIDAHVAAPACGVVKPGQMLMIMGTSACDIVLSEEEKIVEGVSGVVEDGAVAGYFAYEAGQAAVGDIFDWFVTNCVPETYYLEAKARGVNIHQLLEEKASRLKPGQHGLLALDWWNGNRSVLVDADLTGFIVGLNLATKPEEIYRALVEATAFGKRMIIDAFKSQGVDIDELVACGGLSHKNKMLMQIYADITGMTIKIADSDQAPALGAAIFAALAAGKEQGGYDGMLEASNKMAKLKDETYQPIEKNVKIYNQLFEEYRKLHDYFGKGQNNIMKRLKSIKMNSSL
ncbi:L-ribulokinase [Anaerovirgula multivorans]|uniref:Ribulokinase n=1 Tax=Anaerovirgula multivorans TaxID=312168 RepID=A0A239AWV0_9FIRM|nr:ribulokinase [Anaerovirgula multivorans]SNS00165.1 L-ribulokinase [Anaerovirgula multivorans]